METIRAIILGCGCGAILSMVIPWIKHIRHQTGARIRCRK